MPGCGRGFRRCRSRSVSGGLWPGLVTNDFEEHIFAAHPAIRAAKERLLAEGAVYASMSGSGSAVFGLFAGHEKSERLCSLSPFVFGL